MDRHKIIIILINFFLCISINFLDKYKNSVVVIFPSPFLLKLHIYQTSFSQFLLHNCYFQFLLRNLFFNRNFSITLSLCVDIYIYMCVCIYIYIMLHLSYFFNLYFFLFDVSFKLLFIWSFKLLFICILFSYSLKALIYCMCFLKKFMIAILLV